MTTIEKLDLSAYANGSEQFYRHWLGSGTTKAEAWRRAAEAMQAAGERAAWAAFSLTGDWR